MVLRREWNLSPYAFHGDQNTILPAGVTTHESGTEDADLNSALLSKLSLSDAIDRSLDLPLGELLSSPPRQDPQCALKMAMLSPCSPLEPAPSPTQSPLKKTKF